MNENWTRVCISTTKEGIDPLTGALYMQGIEGFEIDDGIEADELQPYCDYVDDELLSKNEDGKATVTIYLKTDSDGMSQLDSVRELIERLKAEGTCGDLEIEESSISEEDWANNWKAYFHPVKVSKRVVVAPTWEKYEPQGDEVVVEIDPGMAFGTGTHETTRMCIQAIEKYMPKNADVLDLGCGSGILSIAAHKLGASNVMAMDSDEMCTKTTLRNAAHNRCLVGVVKGNVLTDVTYRVDMVVANIIADVIIELNRNVRNYIDDFGVYIASGIIESRLPEVLDSLKKNRMKVIEIMEDGDWRTVISKRSL